MLHKMSLHVKQFQANIATFQTLVLVSHIGQRHHLVTEKTPQVLAVPSKVEKFSTFAVVTPIDKRLLLLLT